MDNSSEAGRDGLAWSTPVAAIAALGVGGLVLAGAAVAASSDPAGRLLIGLAALAALSLAVLGTVQRPKLSVDADVLGVRTLRGTRRYRREDVVSMRLVPYPRLGRRVPMLEMDVQDGDTDDRLLIFGRWDLGTDPREVYDVLAVRGWADPSADRN